MAKITRLTLDCSGSLKITPLPTGRVIIEIEDVELTGLPSDPDPIYSKEQAADRLGVSTRAIDNYMRLKKNPLPFSRAGNRPRFRESEIQRWLDGDGVASRRRKCSLGVV